MIYHTIKQHLLDNNGDQSTSKMTLVAIIFVVGAILLLLTTTAFKEPIQNWYRDTIAEWFAEDNGQYSFDPWSMYERNANGTYKGLEYIMELPNGNYVVLVDYDDVASDAISPILETYYYNPDGTMYDLPTSIFPAQFVISADGKTITVDGDVFRAKLP